MIYGVASAYTAAPSADGDRAESPQFNIDRGVLQGDITSPLFFILALQLILRIHDDQPVGVPLGDTMIHTLGYADDLTLVETADQEGILRSSRRVTQISVGSEMDADMHISRPKTKALHVQRQDPVSATTVSEAHAVCKFWRVPHRCSTRVFVYDVTVGP